MFTGRHAPLYGLHILIFLHIDVYRTTCTIVRSSYLNILMFTGRHAPLYGLQWHPEKSLFVFNPVLAVDHSPWAIISSQYIANVFMAEARMNPGKEFKIFIFSSDWIPMKSYTLCRYSLLKSIHSLIMKQGAGVLLLEFDKNW